ncbi:MAG: hypothetical protein N2258_07715 [Brevinematales bacterium]|nr:hypothetical protein [Brevinematales bacterium]
MNVELNNIHLNINKIENNKILLIKVIERLPNGEIIIDLNGERVKTKVDRELPDSFFAYVEKKIDKKNIKIILRIIESFKNLNTSISDKNQLEIIKNFILSNSLPLIEDNIHIVAIMLRKNIPLTTLNFEILKYSLRKYDKFPSFLAEIIQNGKKIDKTFVDIFFNAKEIISHIFSEKNENNISIINDLISLFNALSDNKYNFGFNFEKDKFFVLTKIEKYGEKKRYYFDFSSDRIKNFLVVIDISSIEMDIKVYLEKEVIDNHSSEFEDARSFFIEKLKNFYSEKKITLNFIEFSNNIFENEFSSENKNNIGNLDIII